MSSVARRRLGHVHVYWPHLHRLYAKPVIAAPVSVASPVPVAPAHPLPMKVPPVKVTPVPAITIPLKLEVVMDEACRTHHATLPGTAPPAMITLKLVPVRSPVPAVPILNSQTPVGGPLSVNVPVNAAAAVKQYVPGVSDTPARVPVKVLPALQSPATGANAVYAVRKLL